MVEVHDHTFILTYMNEYTDVYTLTAFHVNGGIFAHVGLIVYN